MGQPCISGLGSGACINTPLFPWRRLPLLLSCCIELLSLIAVCTKERASQRSEDTFTRSSCDPEHRHARWSGLQTLDAAIRTHLVFFVVSSLSVVTLPASRRVHNQNTQGNLTHSSSVLNENWKLLPGLSCFDNGDTCGQPRVAHASHKTSGTLSPARNVHERHVKIFRGFLHKAEHCKIIANVSITRINIGALQVEKRFCLAKMQSLPE